MTRRTWVLVAAIITLICAAILSPLSTSASHPRDVDPHSIDPVKLALPISSLPLEREACLFGMLNASNQVTSGELRPQSAGTAGSLACGVAVNAVAPTATQPGSVTIGATLFAIAPGATVNPIGNFLFLDHSGVSDNNDADGKSTPADGQKAQISIVHSTGYENLGRITGYREDMRYFLQGIAVGTEYLVSIFPDKTAARAAFDDATARDFNILSLIAQPLPGPEQCYAGDICRAYFGKKPPVPNEAPQEAVFTLFVRGPILVETASQVAVDKFDAVRPSVETTLYTMLIAADEQIQAILNPQLATATNTPASPTATPTPSATPTAIAVATATDTPTTTPRKPSTKCPKNATKKKGKCTCKKGYVKKHGKCIKKKK